MEAEFDAQPLACAVAEREAASEPETDPVLETFADKLEVADAARDDERAEERVAEPMPESEDVDV